MSSGLKQGNNAGTPVPRAMIHQKILEAAEDRPEAPLEKLADDVSGASVDLVERVLEKYGDPADPDDPEEEEDDQPSATSAAESGTEDSTPTQETTSASDASSETTDANTSTDGDAPDTDEQLEPETERPAEATAAEPADSAFEREEFKTPFDLTEKQRQVLQAIAENPDATQHEVAELLGVSQSTVSSRLNSIPKFEWSTRQEFIRMMQNENTDPEAYESLSFPAEQLTARVEDLSEQLDTIEERLDTDSEESTGAAFTDPDLAHKVLRACIGSEDITEDEEQRIVQSMLLGTDDSN